MKFKRLGTRFFLMVEPTYLFTTDGEHPVASDRMGRMVLMWGGRQKNPDILRNFMFWAKAIASNKKNIEIETGGKPIIVSAMPALAIASTGIDMEHIRIGALMQRADHELADVAKDVELVNADDAHEGPEEEHEPTAS